MAVGQNRFAVAYLGDACVFGKGARLRGARRRLLSQGTFDESISGVSHPNLVCGGTRALRDATLGELDFGAEVARLEAMAQSVSPWPDLVVPRPWPDLCTRRVLTTDRLDGPTLHEQMDRPMPQSDRNGLGLRLVRAVLGPLLTSGRINADAHPGNFIVMEGDRLGLVDFGAVATLPPPRVEGVARLLGVLTSDRLGTRSGATLRQDWAAAGLDLDVKPVRAEDYILTLTRIVAPMFQGVHDFARDPILLQVGKLKQERPRDTLHVRFDPALLPVTRALLGLHHGLLRLEAVVDLRPTLREILPRER